MHQRQPPRRILYVVGTLITFTILFFQFYDGNSGDPALDNRRWASSGGRLMGDIQNTTLGVSVQPFHSWCPMVLMYHPVLFLRFLSRPVIPWVHDNILFCVQLFHPRY